MKSALFAGAALAWIVLDATVAHAACGGYAKGAELPVHHWETVFAKYRRTTPHPTAAGEAAMGRIVADAELCEQDKISWREFNARIDEAQARLAARTEARDVEPRSMTCDPDGFGGMDCDED